MRNVRVEQNDSENIAPVPRVAVGVVRGIVARFLAVHLELRVFEVRAHDAVRIVAGIKL